MDEIGVLLHHVEDLCQRSQDACMQVHTRFLNGEELVAARRVVKRYPDLEGVTAGGFAECDRSMLCIFPSFLQFQEDQVPLDLLKITLQSQEKLSHRDYLGALLGLGVQRGCIGDIFCFPGHAFVAAECSITPYFCTHLEKVGRYHVKDVCRVSPKEVCIQREYEQLTDTIPSTRLDCVVASVARLPRAKAQELIRGGLVNINHICRSKNDQEVIGGDVLSIRGHGRYIIDDMDHVTRKGRLVLHARKYK